MTEAHLAVKVDSHPVMFENQKVYPFGAFFSCLLNCYLHQLLADFMAGIDFLYDFIGKFPMSLSMDTVIKKSENVVFRKIEDEYILVPMVASAADVESIYNLNETGAAVWERVDGKKSIKDIIEEIKAEYEDEGNQIENNVISFVREMTEAKLIEA